MSTFDWDDLRYILAVVQRRTFVEAAKFLNVNQTTVARRIKGVEQKIGVSLFTVFKNGVEPTQDCLNLAQIAEKIAANVADAEVKLLGKDRELSGYILVTAPDYFLYHYSSIFKAFLEQYPMIQLELKASYNVYNINKREADIAIRVTHNPPGHLLGKKLGEMQFAVYGSQEFSGVSEDNFQNFPWIAWEPSVPSSRIPNNLIFERVDRDCIKTFVDNMCILQKLIQEGVGLSVLPTHVGDNLPGVVKYSQAPDDNKLGLWVLTHMELRQTARIKAFINFLVQKFDE